MLRRDALDRANQLLTQFYRANDADGNRVLEDLLDYLRPCISEFIASKGCTREDLEELRQESIARLIPALRKSQVSAEHHIIDCLAYARTIAQNVLNDSIRIKRPAWYRLKRRLLYILDGRAQNDLFACWELSSGRFGGFSKWRGRSFVPGLHYHDFLSNSNTFLHQRLCDREPSGMPLPELIAHLFGFLDTPLEIDELTSHVAALTGVKEPVQASLDELAEESSTDYENLLPPASVDVAQQVVNDLANEEFRVRLWAEVRDLPPRQRAALLLAMERDDLLLLAGRMTDISDALGVDLKHFAVLWPGLPLPDSAIAQRLGASLVQVSNLRKCARERLSRRLTKWNA